MSSRRSGCADRETSLYANPRDSSVAFARRQWPHDVEVKIVMRPIAPRGRTNRPRVVEVRNAYDVNFSTSSFSSADVENGARFHESRGATLEDHRDGISC
jgi:hypothetical protein